MRSGLPLSAMAIACLALPLAAQHPDHHEFDAALFAPFRAEAGTEARAFKIAFQFPDAQANTFSSWRLELLSPKGEVIRNWHGETLLSRGLGQRVVAWDGLDYRGLRLSPGFYTLRLSAAPLDEVGYRTAPGASAEVRVKARLAQAGAELEIQEQTLLVGAVPVPKVQARQPLRVGHQNTRAQVQPGGRQESTVAAPAGLPYTILLGNLHSQTNHSDGGTPVASCGGAETPQGGVVGPAEAFEMMRVQAGGDFLLASEHNHMYDGSTSENTAADTLAAKALWQAGADAAAAYQSAHPGYMALYGNEWGVITNGGHMNLLNPDGLANWEHGAGGALTGHFEVPKSDYAAMYALMMQRGWIGQFNHPKTTTQFLIGGIPLGFDANGAEVMALCEVMNSSAFSINTTETETGRSFFTSAWNILLERGFKVAPSTNQDNHCANYGLSFRNRTGVLIPNGSTPTLQGFLDAVKARRVFATMDKTGQLVLTANGHVMGESFPNSGPLTLTANYASTSGQTASRVQFFEGVPGRNGTVTQLFEGADTTTLTPASGEHFYYAVLTQANGDQLWTAPVWVSQDGSPVGTVTATITDPTGNLTVESGTTLSFAGSATSSAGNPLTYSWNFGDGGSAAGPTASHTFANAGLSAVNFTVTLTANDGSTTGMATRVITVNPIPAGNTAPTITSIPDQAVALDGAMPAVGFTIGDAETPVASLTLSAASSNPALIPVGNIVLGGSGSARSVALSPAAGQSGSAVVTLTVTDGAGATATSAFTVTVTPPNSGGSLLISQYYEGASSDKWLEITNVGSGPLNLALPQCYLALFSNTAADAPDGVAPTSSLALSGALAPGQSLLFKNSAAVLPTYATGPASGVINFNGDDLVILTTATGTAAWANRIDVVGNGTTWGADTSFVRKGTVLAPNPTFNLAEWTPFSITAVNGAAGGTTERLGIHLTSAPANIVTAEITTPAADLSVASGASVAFAGSGTDSNPAATLSFDWAFGDGATATGATASHAYLNDTAANRVFITTLTVTDDSGVSASATRTVTVNPAPDITAPTVSASETGTQGLITLSAIATDNRGVTRVDFLVDGLQVGTDPTEPFTMTLDSLALANGSHSLVAQATDAAGNVGTSTPLSFTISNTMEALLNPGFESGAVQWTGTAGVITNSASRPARTGAWYAKLNGLGTSNTQTLAQTVSLPSSLSSATLSFWLRVDSAETKNKVFDTLKVQVRNASGAVLATLATYSNQNKGTTYLQKTFNLSAYKGQTIQVTFLGVEGSSFQTSFLIDDASLLVN